MKLGPLAHPTSSLKDSPPLKHAPERDSTTETPDPPVKSITQIKNILTLNSQVELPKKSPKSSKIWSLHKSLMRMKCRMGLALNFNN